MKITRPSSIVIIGARGQLGTDLQTRLGSAAVGLDLPELDATRADQVAEALEALRPQTVINCAALTHVDQCEREPEVAFAVNALAALHVARAAARCEAALVYISTDYVFGADAERSTPYSESDLPGPVNVYGAAKLAGEHLTRAVAPVTYIVRTSGLYGAAGARGKGGNFVETMLRLARAGQPIRVVDDQRLAPTSTAVLAEQVVDLLQTGRPGVYHVAARDSCTWFEFAGAVFAHARLAADLRPIPSSAYPLPARRPAFSALGSEQLAAVGVAPCPPWREMLARYLEHRTCAQAELA